MATHTLTIGSPMQVLASDFVADGSAVSVDQVTVLTHAPSGTFTSRVLDVGSSSTWGGLATTATTPAGTGIAYETRTGNVSVPDGTWSAAPGGGGAIASPTGRYLRLGHPDHPGSGGEPRADLGDRRLPAVGRSTASSPFAERRRAAST